MFTLLIRAIYQAVCIEDNVEWKILGSEVVIAVSWEHQNSSSHSKKARFHCIYASTGKMLLEEYISNESLYEVFSDCFHAYRIDLSSAILGIQFASSMDAECLAQVFSNVLALELHRKVLVDETVDELQRSLRSEASVTYSSFGDVPNSSKKELDNKTFDETTSQSGISIRPRRPISSMSSLQNCKTSRSIKDNTSCVETKQQMDSISSRNSGKSFLFESNMSNCRQPDLNSRREEVFETSRKTSKFFDRSLNSSGNSLNRSLHCEQRTSRRWLSQLPIEISRCTLSEKHSFYNRRSFQPNKSDVSLSSTIAKAYSNGSVVSGNSEQELQIHGLDERDSAKIQWHSFVSSKHDSCTQQSTSSSSSKSNTVVNKQETRLSPQSTYEDILAELSLVAHEKIQEFIQSFLRESIFNPSTKNFCKSTRKVIDGTK